MRRISIMESNSIEFEGIKTLNNNPEEFPTLQDGRAATLAMTREIYTSPSFTSQHIKLSLSHHRAAVCPAPLCTCHTTG